MEGSSGMTGKTIVLAWLLVLSPGTSCLAATGISGRVTYSDDSTGAAGAVVQTDHGGYAVADSGGCYSLTTNSFGATRLRAWVLGMKPANVVSATVVQGSTVTADLVINRGQYYHTTPVITIYRAQTPPTIDGTVDPLEWADAPGIEPFYDTTDDAAKPLQSTVRALYDDTNFYFAFDCIEDDMPGLVARAIGHDDSAIWSDDHVEVQIDPKHLHGGFDGTDGPSWYPEFQGMDGSEPGYQFAANCAEQPYTAWADVSNARGNLTDYSYNAAGLQAAAHRGTGHWYVEMKVPIAAIPGLTGAPAAGYVMGMQFTRGRPTSHATDGMEWSGTDYTLWSYWMATQWNDAVFAGSAPAFTSSTGFVKGGKWNLVSVPADPINPDPPVVFSTIELANSSFQFWNNNAVGGGYQSYGTLFGWTGPVVRGTPYWFLEPGRTDNTEIRFSGTAPGSDFEMTIPARVAAPFWIMFGTPFPNPVPADSIQFKNVAKRGDLWLSWTEAFSESNASLRIVDSNAQGWSAELNRFNTMGPTAYMAESHQAEPWWGYWMLVFDPNELQIRFPKP